MFWSHSPPLPFLIHPLPWPLDLISSQHIHLPYFHAFLSDLWVSLRLLAWVWMEGSFRSMGNLPEAWTEEHNSPSLGSHQLAPTPQLRDLVDVPTRFPAGMSTAWPAGTTAELLRAATMLHLEASVLDLFFSSFSSPGSYAISTLSPVMLLEP